MHSFDWIDARSVEEAVELLGEELQSAGGPRPAAWICSI